MIKGWRNDPRWVAYYAQRDRERIEREIARMKAAHEIEIANARADSARRQLQFRPSLAGEASWA